jgi:hypothetical protein
VAVTAFATAGAHGTAALAAFGAAAVAAGAAFFFPKSDPRFEMAALAEEIVEFAAEAVFCAGAAFVALAIAAAVPVAFPAVVPAVVVPAGPHGGSVALPVLAAIG